MSDKSGDVCPLLIPVPLYRALEQQAHKQGLSVVQLIAKALTAALQEN